jgi:hypothetical protein
LGHPPLHGQGWMMWAGHGPNPYAPPARPIGHTPEKRRDIYFKNVIIKSAKLHFCLYMICFDNFADHNKPLKVKE